MRKGYILATVTLLLAAAFAVSAQQTTDYSGDWKLDTSKSELGERARIKSMTMNVSQTAVQLTYDRKTEREAGGSGDGGGRGPGGGGRGMGGGEAGAVTFSLDGKETNVQMGPSEAKLKAKSDKGKLKLTTERNVESPMGSISLTTVETWELSSDGKTLTIASETKTPRGDRSTKMIFTKE